MQNKIHLSVCWMNDEFLVYLVLDQGMTMFSLFLYFSRENIY